MKVYSLPAELTATLPEHDYINDSYEVWAKEEADHKETIRVWLKKMGFTGKNSGLIYKSQIADGYAEYMMVEGPGQRSSLMHLPYCDGYQDPDVSYLPKKEILERIKGRAKIDKLFGG